MWYRGTLACCILLALVPAAFGDSKERKALGAARETYVKHCREIVAAHEKRDLDSVAAYKQSLRRLLDSSRKAGDLDGWQAVKGEIERFDGSTTLDESHLVLNVPSLKAVQVAFRDARKESASEKNSGIVALAEKYTKHLKKLERRCTKAGQMEDALACRAEAERAEASPEVSSARFAIAASELEDGSGEQVERVRKNPGEAPKARPSPVEKQPASDAGKARTVAGCLVHEGAGGSAGGVFLKRLTLRPSSRGRVARRVSVQAQGGDLSESTSRSSSSSSSLSYYYSYYYGKSKSASTDTMVRLRVRAPQEVTDISVIVQLFTKPIGAAGTITPGRAGIYRIPFDQLGRDWVTIDCPPVSTSRSRSRSSYYSSTRKSGRDFFGLAVTVLDAQGTLLYEGVSSPALTDFAEIITNEPTREETLANLRAEYERTRERYYAVPSRDTEERSRAREAYYAAREAYSKANGGFIPSRGDDD